MPLMIQSDYVAQIAFLTCAVWSLFRLCSWEKINFPFFVVFVVAGIPASFIWLLSLWQVWNWAFPVAMLILAGAAGESAWKMVSQLATKWERGLSHAFSLSIGVAFAGVTLMLHPLFPRFSTLAYRVAMMAASFSCGVTGSAVMYWWANRSAGVRPVVLQGNLLGVYGAVVIISAVISNADDSLWHDCVDISCLIRGALVIAATKALDRKRSFVVPA
jgi:hypothetical protein